MRPAVKRRLLTLAAAASLLLSCVAAATDLARGPSSRPAPPVAGTVRGQILDRAGNPVHNALVGLRRAEDAHEPRPPEHSVRTGKLGDFRLQGVQPGRYVIFPNHRTQGTVLMDDVAVHFGRETVITLRFDAPPGR
jgi:hypothetical protein